MRAGISPRNLERLSAYLDSALSPRDRAQIEQRLGAEPTLAAALKELEGTRALLRRAPQRRTPHNFSLTRSMVAASKPHTSRGWNSLNLVSAAATLMLVLVLVGDFWAAGQLGLGAAAPAAEEPAAFLAQEADMKASETNVPEFGEAAPQATGEFQLYAEPAETNRAMGDDGAPFELRSFMQQNARSLEIGLGAIVLITSVLAWRQRRHGA
ncbi:MAG: hypothetical protein WD740_01415 [Anaerolineales bacterium]